MPPKFDLTVAAIAEDAGRFLMVQERAVVRTLWLDRRELEARAREHRSPLVMASIDDYLRGPRHSLELLRQLPLDGIEARMAVG